MVSAGLFAFRGRDAGTGEDGPARNWAGRRGQRRGRAVAQRWRRRRSGQGQGVMQSWRRCRRRTTRGGRGTGGPGKMATRRILQGVRGVDPTNFATWRPHGFCRSEEHTSELQSLMRNSYAVFCLKKKKRTKNKYNKHNDLRE